MLVVVLGAVECLVCWQNNILMCRHIDECLAAISASDNDIHAQCWGRRRRRGQLSSLRHRVSQRRNRVLLPGHYLVHGHRGQQWTQSGTVSQIPGLNCRAYKVKESVEKSDEESTCRMEWLEKNVRSDLRHASTSLSGREGVQGGSETSN